MFLVGAAIAFVVRTGPHASPTLCDLGCVWTYGYNNARNNVNPSESTLNANNLFSTAPIIQTSPDLKGSVYGQPLFLSHVTVKGTNTNALFVATEENYVYALDADHIDNTTPLWTLSLNQAHETAVPDGLLPTTCDNIPAEVGVTGTGVIDVGTLIMYVVSKHYFDDGTSAVKLVQRLNAISIADGTLKYTYDMSNLTDFSPLNQNQRSGLALMHDGNNDPVVVVTWGSHCDAPADGYNGRVVVFEGLASSFSKVGDFSTTPVDIDSDYPNQGGTWMSGAAPAIDDGDGSTVGDIYLSVGNGLWDNTTTPPNWGETALRLRLTVSASTLVKYGFYTPGQWAVLNNGSYTGMPPTCTSPLNLPHPVGGTVCLTTGDWDFGSGGVTLAFPVGSAYSSAPHPEMLSGGKTGIVYALDPTQMHSNTTVDSVTSACTTGSGGQAVDCLTAIKLPSSLPLPDYGDRCSMAFWDGPGGTGQFPVNAIYVAGAQDIQTGGKGQIRAWQMNTDGSFNTVTQYGTVDYPGLTTVGQQTPYPGSCPVISWNSVGGTHAADAILWILDTHNYQAHGSTTASPVGLYAYTALPNTTTHAIGGANGWAGDITHGPGASKFMVPTVVNGHIYVAGQRPSPTTCLDIYANTTGCTGQVVSWH